VSIQFRDSITPGLVRCARQVGDRKPILEAMGVQLVSLTKRAFSDSSLRPSAWPARTSGGTNSLLRKSGALWQSIRITELTNNSVTVGTDRVYAAIHQLGGKITAKPGKRLVFSLNGKKIFAKEIKMPARPFFPFTSNGTMISTAQANRADSAAA
jgi:phage gpG-like protein